MNKQIKEKGRIDWLITLVPFALIMGLAIFLFIFKRNIYVVSNINLKLFI